MPFSSTRGKDPSRGCDEGPSVIRFFVDVQNKTRVETNLQASGVLPSLNSFEARAMRVVVSGPNPDRCEQNPDLFIPELIYGSVVSLLVGEKENHHGPDVHVPVWCGRTRRQRRMPRNHGEPDPLRPSGSRSRSSSIRSRTSVSRCCSRGGWRNCSRKGSDRGISGSSSTAISHVMCSDGRR